MMYPNVIKNFNNLSKFGLTHPAPTSNGPQHGRKGAVMVLPASVQAREKVSAQFADLLD